MVQADLKGLDILQSIVDGKTPMPPMAQTIPMSIISVAPGSVFFTAIAGKQHLNPMGGVHGGFAATVLDSVTGCAVHSLLESGIGYATVDLNVKMVRPVPRDREVTAIGKVIHISGRLAVSEGRLQDGDGKILAHATATCMILRG
ncbi:PaaI family thioesterase [Desulfopila sp. IMCC35006]|nr:PaaI family thioesterase [Desulfopila sp. IMCC35006]